MAFQKYTITRIRKKPSINGTLENIRVFFTITDSGGTTQDGQADIIDPVVLSKYAIANQTQRGNIIEGFLKPIVQQIYRDWAKAMNLNPATDNNLNTPAEVTTEIGFVDVTSIKEVQS